jgi:hypothetical protein
MPSHFTQYCGIPLLLGLTLLPHLIFLCQMIE